jgi:uncharacterized protein (DUF4415 family)
MTAKKRSIKSDLKKVDRHRIKAAEYDDAPELTAEQLAKAVVVKQRGRPALGDDAKVAIKLRLDPAVLNAYRKTGTGWQSRINADLQKSARKLKA